MSPKALDVGNLLSFYESLTSLVERPTLIDKFPSLINHFRRENTHLDRSDPGSGRHAALFQITGHQLPDLGVVVDDKDMRLRGHNQSGSARTARRIAILSPLSSGWVQAR